MEVVCGCMRVTRDDIVAAIENGARSFEEVKEITKLGTGCGGCTEKNRELVTELLAK